MVPVYDLMNCGPNHAFTVLSDDGKLLLVHNCLTFDPRLEGNKRIPFITYPFQDKVLGILVDSIGKEDIIIEKSRDMGATWLCLAVFLWRWQFWDGETFLLMSRKEDMVDKSGDPKTLMWKIDFMLEFQPSWLRPKYERRQLHLANLQNGSTIDGESTTGEASKGDRRTAIMVDEFASVDDASRPREGHKLLEATKDVTNSRWFVSTHNGVGTAFHDLCQRAEEVSLA